ncbi:hypothetical protein QYF36_021900 [Acer negundo]|nr:hypothetical protein QYF36_021900 [Acer negundo]
MLFLLENIFPKFPLICYSQFLASSVSFRSPCLHYCRHISVQNNRERQVQQESSCDLQSPDLETPQRGTRILSFRFHNDCASQTQLSGQLRSICRDNTLVCKVW